MNSSEPHKGWHSRGYLPHLDAPGELQALTFRLADSVPTSVVESWKRELGINPSAEAELRKRIAKYEDAGHGSALLGIGSHAKIVQDCLLHDDGVRYRLIEWCVMPNHVHVLVEPFEGMTLGAIVRSWKTFTSRAINREEGRSGGLWAKDYHDRFIRDQSHFESARAYIRNNPVKAGLCARPKDWPWGSAVRVGGDG